jgi:hypothetical protein
MIAQLKIRTLSPLTEAWVNRPQRRQIALLSTRTAHRTYVPVLIDGSFIPAPRYTDYLRSIGSTVN